MALSASCVWELRPAGASSNGGGFNVGNANFPTDGAVSSANTSAPVVSSASYTFVAGDVGALWFAKSGTNLLPGFYPIASVSGGNATLGAAIGAANLYGGATVLNTVAGVSASSSLSSITWGIDYSQQTSPQFTFTDLVIDGTTNTKFTSAGFPVGKNFVGNVFNVTSGTGFTTGRFEVVSTTGTAGTADRSLGTLSSTGGNAKLGGCLDGLVTLAGAAVASNRAFVVGSFTQTATATFTAATVVPNFGNTGTPTRVTGYTTYRGDGGRATITLSTNTGLTAVKFTNNGCQIENLSIDCASLGTSTGISTAQYAEIVNCKVQNFTTSGIATTNTNMLISACELTAGTSAATSAITLGSTATVVGCNVHDNACPGITGVGFGTAIVGNLITGNTGASSDGITGTNGTAAMIVGNTIHGSGRAGIKWTTGPPRPGLLVRGNLITGNGALGLDTNSPLYADPCMSGNAYWSNTSGPRTSLDVGSSSAIDGVAPYIESLDVILTSDPYVAKSSNDFRLNTTGGGGAACRGFGVPTTWPGNSLTVSAPDMGAAQHVDSGGGGTTNIFSGEF